MNILKHSLFLAGLLMIVAACSPQEQEQAQQEQYVEQLQTQMVQTTPEFNDQMSTVLVHYFDLKDALVESDTNRAKAAAERLKKEAEQVQQHGINEEAMALWLGFRNVIGESSHEISELDNVDDQRYRFEFISESMIAMVENFDPVGYEIYHQSCPMVRGGTAEWLSREERIRNPYHGDRMMNCGETIRRI